MTAYSSMDDAHKHLDEKQIVHAATSLLAGRLLKQSRYKDAIGYCGGGGDTGVSHAKRSVLLLHAVGQTGRYSIRRAGKW
jgi:hypothetical protein